MLDLLRRPAVRLGAGTAHQHRPFAFGDAVGQTEGLDGLLEVDDPIPVAYSLFRLFPLFRVGPRRVIEIMPLFRVGPRRVIEIMQ